LVKTVYFAQELRALDDLLPTSGSQPKRKIGGAESLGEVGTTAEV